MSNEITDFDCEFQEWLERMEKQIEQTRQSEILTAEDYETTITV